MFDVITFGSGTKDVYFVFKHLPKSFLGDETLDIKFGVKMEADDVLFRTGGGGTNVAVALRKMGYNVAWAGMVGNDDEGKSVLDELRDYDVSTNLAMTIDSKKTNQSAILISPGKDRSIVIYRGASSEFGKENIIWEQLQAKWFYIAPGGGKSADLFCDLIKFAKQKNIKVFFNPGARQIEVLKKKCKDLLMDVDILSINEEEFRDLTGKIYINEKQLAKDFAKLTDGIWLYTRGKKGSIVGDGKKTYTAGIIDVPVVDTTGAGDSFNAGFLAAYMKSQDIVQAIQLATANSAKNVTDWGAKAPILASGESFSKVEVKVKDV